MLVLGSGPVAATRRFPCAGGHGETVSCDAFARLYRQLAFETGFWPPEGFPECLDGVRIDSRASGMGFLTRAWFRS